MNVQKFQIEENDPELKSTVFSTYVGNDSKQSPDFQYDRLSHMSSFQHVFKVVASCLQFKNKLMKREERLSTLASANSAAIESRVRISLTELQQTERNYQDRLTITFP